MSSKPIAVLYLNLLFLGLSIIFDLVDWKTEFDAEKPANLFWKASATLGPASALVG